MKPFEPIRVIIQAGDPYQNPIVIALTRHEDPDPDFNSPVAKKVQLVFLQGLGMSFAGILSTLIPFGALCLFPLATLTIFGVPILFAVDAVRLSTSLITSGDYQPIKLSGVGPVECAWGLMFATLHRLRFFILLFMALLPYDVTAITITAGFEYPEPPHFLLTIFLITMSLVGMPLVGLTAGVLTTLRYKELELAILISVGFTLSVMVLLMVGILILSEMRFHWLAASLIIVPFVLTIAGFYLAERWA